MRARWMLAFPVLVACSKAPPATAASPEPAPPAEPAMTAAMPDEADARKFAKQLVATELTGVNPTGSSEFSLAMQFAGDGGFTAQGHASLGGETLDCEETGTWRIEAMEGDRAVMDWTLSSTNCPNRTTGDTQHVVVGFSGSDYTINFR